MLGFGLSDSGLKTLLSSAKILHYALFIFQICSSDVYPEAHQREI